MSRRKMLRRYTTIPVLLDLLAEKRLTFREPRTWDDRNAAFYMAQYRAMKGLKLVSALCFSEANETYHHWRVFSGDPGGVCVSFIREELIAAMKKIDGVVGRAIKYHTINDSKSTPPKVDDLPFVKRRAYQDEKEFRFVFSQAAKTPLLDSVPIDLTSIYKVTLSPWLHESLFNSVKSTIRKIDGCKSLSVKRSFLLESEAWKEIAKAAHR